MAEAKGLRFFFTHLSGPLLPHASGPVRPLFSGNRGCWKTGPEGSHSQPLPPSSNSAQFRTSQPPPGPESYDPVTPGVVMEERAALIWYLRPRLTRGEEEGLAERGTETEAPFPCAGPYLPSTFLHKAWSRGGARSRDATVPVPVISQKGTFSERFASPARRGKPQPWGCAVTGSSFS